MNDNDMEYNTENQTEKKKKYTKGFYIVFALCLCAIGIAGWYTYADVANYMNDNEIPDTAITSSEPENKQAEAKVKGVEKTTEKAKPTEKETEPSTEEPTEIATEISTETQKVSPVGENKEIVAEYSGERLVYFDTLKDWRLHKGTDYAVKEGSEVYSVSDGTVTATDEDNLYGDSIEIEYTDGFTAVYYGVKAGDNIAIGAKLTAGEVIGTVQNVPCEKSLKSHIHLEIKRDGKNVNPENYLNNN